MRHLITGTILALTAAFGQAQAEDASQRIVRTEDNKTKTVTFTVRKKPAPASVALKALPESELYTVVPQSPRTPPENDGSLPLYKQARILNPLALIIAHADHFFGPDRSQDNVKIAGQTYKVYKSINDESGLAADVLMNTGTGHAVIMYMGLNRPGDGRGGMMGLGGLVDAFQALASKVSGINGQYGAAEDLYKTVLKDPVVRSVEVFGFSMGTTPANILAYKFGAKVTSAADLGARRDILEWQRNEAMQDPAVKAYLETNKLDVVSARPSGDWTSALASIGAIIGRNTPGCDSPGLNEVDSHQPESYARWAQACMNVPVTYHSKRFDRYER